MNKLTKITIALMLALAVNSSHAALSITGASGNTMNFGLQDSSILPDQAIFQIGYYATPIESSTFNEYTSGSFFEVGWTSLATSTANAFDVSGLRSATAELATGENTYEGKTLYMLVGNASDMDSSTQAGVFTNANWIVPANPTSILPGAFSFDVSDIGTEALFGSLSLGTGAYSDQGVVDSANLAVIIPEPSSLSLLALGVAGLVALRARRKS